MVALTRDCSLWMLLTFTGMLTASGKPKDRFCRVMVTIGGSLLSSTIIAIASSGKEERCSS